ncbi:MAG: CAP domain-containing protein [Thaumarchaeota archaeon]|nr:CAP domain-containing protein [Nitrososphaerota archaeon]
MGKTYGHNYYRDRHPKGNKSKIALGIAVFVIAVLVIVNYGSDLSKVLTELPKIQSEIEDAVEDFTQEISELELPDLEPDINNIENLVHKYTNQERAQYQRTTLKDQGALDNYARSHSQKMLNSGNLVHSNLGVSCSGYKGENIQQNYLALSDESTARSIVDTWMDSKGHRDNILSPNFQQLGVGIAVSGVTVYATQVFC